MKRNFPAQNTKYAGMHESVLIKKIPIQIAQWMILYGFFSGQEGFQKSKHLWKAYHPLQHWGVRWEIMWIWKVWIIATILLNRSLKFCLTGCMGCNTRCSLQVPTFHLTSMMATCLAKRATTRNWARCRRRRWTKGRRWVNNPRFKWGESSPG